jgi:hypothetical protein
MRITLFLGVVTAVVSCKTRNSDMLQLQQNSLDYVPGPFLLRFLKPRKTIDCLTDRLFYRATVSLLVLFALLLGSKEHIGEPIHCSGEGFDKEFINTYCWTKGTFTVRQLADVRIAEEVAHPGVGYFDDRVHDRVHQGYYHWVPLYFPLMAAVFYLPRAAWKAFEHGQIAELTMVDETVGVNSEECLRWISLVCTHFGRYRLASNLYVYTYYLTQLFYPISLACMVSFLSTSCRPA